MDCVSKLAKLYQLAEQLQSARDEITEMQMGLNAEVDKFQEKINDVFVEIYSVIGAIKSVEHEDHFGILESQTRITTESEVDKDNTLEPIIKKIGELGTPSKQPRFDLDAEDEDNESDLPKIVLDDAEILALEEAKIPEQFETLSSTRFPKTVDWKNPEIYHGLEKLTSANRIEEGKLMRNFDCFCGLRFEKGAPFRKHFDNNSASEDYSVRCTLCGKGFQWYRGLVKHTKVIHGIILDDEPPKSDATRRREMLETWRDSTSKLLRVTPYCVLLDAQLESLAENPPASRELLCDQLGEPQVELLGNFIHTLFRLLSVDGERFFEEMQYGPGGSQTKEPTSLQSQEASCSQLQENFSGVQQEEANPAKTKKKKRRGKGRMRNRLMFLKQQGGGFITL